MEAKAKYDDLNTPAIALVGFVSAIATFVIIVGLEVVYYRFENTYRTETESQYHAFDAANLMARQQADLANYGWVDREQQKVAIPIDRAKSLVLRDLTATAQRPDSKPDSE